MTGLPDYNYPAFQSALEELASSGITVLSPHLTDFGETKETRGKTRGYEYYLKAVLSDLLKANGLILLSGWPTSKGARLELDIALDLEYPVYFYNNWTLTSMGSM